MEYNLMFQMGVFLFNKKMEAYITLLNVKLSFCGFPWV